MIKKFYNYLKKKSNELEKEVIALYIAYKRPDVPIYAKIVAIIVVGYALSPIDLIPDFIPIIGYLDDLILIPLGIGLAIKLIPKSIMNECRLKAESQFEQGNKKSFITAIIIICIWISIVAYIIYKFL